MSIKTLALAVTVVAGTIGFTNRADAQVVVEPSISTSYYSPVDWGVSYSGPFVGLSLGTPYYGGFYDTGYYGRSYLGYPYYSGYYGTGYGYPYYGGGFYTGYGWGRRGWRR